MCEWRYISVHCLSRQLLEVRVYFHISLTPAEDSLVDSRWNVMAHGYSRVGEVKGKLANGVGSQYPSRYLGTWCLQHYYRWCAHQGCQYSTELTPPADLNRLVRFAERKGLVSARMPSHFNWLLPTGQEAVWDREPVSTPWRREMSDVFNNLVNRLEKEF